MSLLLRAVSLNELPILSRSLPASVRKAARSAAPTATRSRCPIPSVASRAASSARATSSRTSAVPIRSSCASSEQSLALGESAPLKPGYQVRIRGYLLVITSDGGDDRTTVDQAAARVNPFVAIAARAATPPTARAPAFPPSSPFVDLGQQRLLGVMRA